MDEPFQRSVPTLSRKPVPTRPSRRAAPARPVLYETTEFYSARTLMENSMREDHDDDFEAARASSSSSTAREKANPRVRIYPRAGSESGYSTPRPQDAESRNMGWSSRSSLGRERDLRHQTSTRTFASMETPASSIAPGDEESVADEDTATLPTVGQTSQLEKVQFIPIESPSFLPEYVIDNFHKKSPNSNAFFCVFRRSYVLRADGMSRHDGSVPYGQNRLWEFDSIVGHLFEVTGWGALKYHGPFAEEDEEGFIAHWSRISNIKELKDPATEKNTFFRIPNNYYNGTVFALDGSLIPKCTEFQAASEDVKFKFKPEVGTLTGPCFDEVVDTTQINAVLDNTGETGTWKRLFNFPGSRLVAHPSRVSPRQHVFEQTLLYLNFTRLVGLMLTLGKIHPRNLASYIVNEPELAFVTKNTTLNQQVYQTKYLYPSLRLKIPVNKWENDGWMVTELEGMDVLLS